MEQKIIPLVAALTFHLDIHTWMKAVYQSTARALLPPGKAPDLPYAFEGNRAEDPTSTLRSLLQKRVCKVNSYQTQLPYVSS